MMARLEIITGPMFCGKSEELVKRLRVGSYANKKILLLKPARDDRNIRNIFRMLKQDKRLKNYKFLSAHVVKSCCEIKNLIKNGNPDIVALDEAQFFENWLPKFIDKLLADNSDSDLVIIVSGLDMDAWRRPFHVMAQLMAMADDIDKQPAICSKCKGKRGNGILTQKKTGGKKRVEIGSKIYEARCRSCQTIPI